MTDRKNEVFVYLDANNIAVDNDFLAFALSVDSMVNPPERKNEILTITWTENKTAHPLAKGLLSYGDQNPTLFNEEKYDDWVQPFVDAFYAEKNRIEQEEKEQEAEYNKFENRQARALEQLNQDFQIAADRAHVASSLGFTADANSTANENVNGLLVTIGDGTVQFCDYYNEFHALNKAQLETLQSEIIQNGQNLYAQKWQYRTAIENCTDNEGLDAIVATIEFTYMDFSTAS